MRGKVLGGWLAVGVLVAAAGWGGRRHESHHSARVTHEHPSVTAGPTLRVPDMSSTAMQAPIALDAGLMRRAMRDKVLRVELQDGTAYPVRLESSTTDAAGRWTVLGRVRTSRGVQPMVLTFGADATFGVLPLPHGRALQVVTQPGGQVTIAPMGGLSPGFEQLRDRANDYRIPAQPRRFEASAPASARTLAGDAAVRSFAAAGSSSTSKAVRRSAGALPATTPIEVDVLAMYSPELVTLRGSKAAAETEIANMFAIANQAHVDSGSRVVLQLVGMQQVALPIAFTNDEILDLLTSGSYQGTDFEGLRDATAADLAVYVRPLPAGEATCGTSWLNGAGYGGNNGLLAEHAYAVASVAPCGPYVLAHELGHLLGAAHDRDAQTSLDGRVSHGAFPFSFGYVTRSFATVMADPGSLEWLGRFSSPDADCNNAACGIGDRVDNVRTFNRMAPAIAAFRNPSNTAWIADVAGYETRNRVLRVPIRTSFAPKDGAMFHVDIIGGTLSGTEYFDSYSHDLFVPPGERETFFPIILRDDATVEGDETLIIRVTGPSGLTIVDDEAVVTVIDDDPRPVVTGKLIVPNGVTLPANLLLTLGGDTGTDSTQWTSQFWVSAPDYEFAIPVIPGAPVWVEFDPTFDGAFARPTRLNEVWESQRLDMVLDKAVRVTGTVQTASGMQPQADLVSPIYHEQSVDGVVRVAGPVWFDEASNSYAMNVIPGATLLFYVDGTMLPTQGNTAPFATWAGRFTNVRSSLTINPVRSSTYSLVAREPVRMTEGELANVEVERIALAPANTVQFHWHTVDRTAKAGTNYVAANGIATIGPYERSIVLPIETIDDNKLVPAGTFDVVIDQISGAVMAVPTVTVKIGNNDLHDGGPAQRATQ